MIYDLAINMRTKKPLPAAASRPGTVYENPHGCNSKFDVVK